MISTSCEKCLFAEFNDTEQTDCRMNRLDTYRKQGVLTEKQNEDGVRHHFIEGRMCRASVEGDSELSRTVPFEQQPAAMRMHLVTNVDAVVVISDEKRTEELKTLVEDLNAQQLPARKVQFVNLCPPSTHLSLMNFLNKEAKCESKWAFSQIREELKGDYGQDLLRAIKTAVSYLRNDDWFVVLHPGMPVPSDFFARIDQSLNNHDELARYSILKSPSLIHHGMVVQTGFYNSTVINNGRYAPDIIERCEVYIEGCLNDEEEPEDKSYLIADLLEVVPSFLPHVGELK